MRLKFWKDLQNLIKIRKKGKIGDVDIDDDPAADAAEQLMDENKNLNTLRMTTGERDKTFGINKKIVNLGVIFVVVLIIVAFFYKTMGSDESAKSQRNVQQQKQEQASKNAALKSGDGALDYKDPNVAKLAQAEQNATKKSGTAQRNTANTMASQVNNQPSRGSVPAIRSSAAPVSYSAPYVLPSAPLQSYPSYTPVTAQKSNSSVQQNNSEEKSLADRFKSAIAFALGDTTAAPDSSTDVASASSSSGSDNGGFSYSAPSSDVLQAGTVIPVMLYSGINTDTAGQVTAQVESDVYDTATGSNLLIPVGSRIIGSYESGANESGRVNVTFSTIVLPDGGSYSVGSSMVAVDGQGYNGIQGNLHRHSAQKIGNGLLNAAFTALSTISVDRVTLGSDTFNNLTSNEVKPTITVDPGYEFNIYVTQPIAFSN